MAGMPITTVPMPLRLSCCLLLATACTADHQVDQASSAICSIENDGTTEQSPDGIADTVTRHYYNAAGDLEATKYDTNGDGDMDESSIYLYDAFGKNLRSERRHLATGELLRWQEQVFDSEGRLVLRIEDNDADGFAEQSEVRVYDELGVRITKTTSGIFDKSVQSVQEEVFGPFGIEKSRHTTRNGNTESTAQVLYTYEDGLLMTTEDYRGEELFSLTEHRYNDWGHKTSSLTSRGEDKSLQTYVLDERGYVAGWTVDEGLDGSIDGRASCVSDQDGRMIYEEMDTDNDGVIDYLFDLQFDDQGRLVQDLLDIDGDHSGAKRVIRYRYDCDDGQ